MQPGELWKLVIAARAADTRRWRRPARWRCARVCWWEDDGQEDGDAGEVRLTVNGALSLDEARKHYAQCGAAHPRFLPYVRKPQVTEQ
jgi:hypothetical protein